MRGQRPLITYDQQLLGSGLGEGEQQLGALNHLSVMRRYLADWRFVVQQVASANATDCAAMENNAVGLGWGAA